MSAAEGAPREARDSDATFADAERQRAHLVERGDAGAPSSAPIPMVLYCPNLDCGAQHIDAPEPERACCRDAAPASCDKHAPLWTNPPHKSHLCHECGTVWRPADVPTVGVARIATRGAADTWPPDDPRPIAALEDQAPARERSERDGEGNDAV